MAIDSGNELFEQQSSVELESETEWRLNFLKYFMNNTLLKCYFKKIEKVK